MSVLTFIHTTDLTHPHLRVHTLLHRRDPITKLLTRHVWFMTRREEKRRLCGRFDEGRGSQNFQLLISAFFYFSHSFLSCKCLSLWPLLSVRPSLLSSEAAIYRFESLWKDAAAEKAFFHPFAFQEPVTPFLQLLYRLLLKSHSLLQNHVVSMCHDILNINMSFVMR